MAITKIHAVKASVQKAVDYICNPDKTDGKLLVDSFACGAMTAGEEFRFALSHGNGRGDNKAFHLIQSFAPEEVTPEEAHRIGQELAERLLKGNHSYVLSTHVNTGSVHNHIIFCAVDNFEHKKYLDNKKTYRILRGISDDICREHGLSVIGMDSIQKGQSYKEWMSEKAGVSWKTALRNNIRECIAGADTYEDFLRLMRGKGYEIKGEMLPYGRDEDGSKIPKYISFRAPGYHNFVRGCERSLGKGFTKEEIARAIAGGSLRRKLNGRLSTPQKDVPFWTGVDPERPVRNVADAKKRDVLKYSSIKPALINTSEDRFQSSPGLKRWAEKKNLQAAAHVYAEVGSLTSLEKRISEAEQALADINEEIVKNRETVSELKELAVYVQNFEKYKGYDTRYRNAKDKEKYYESHESQLMIFDAAVRHIRSRGLDPDKVSYEQVMQGIQRLKEKNDSLLEGSRSAKNDIRDMNKQMELIREYMGMEQKQVIPPRSKKSGLREI